MAEQAVPSHGSTFIDSIELLINLITTSSTTREEWLAVDAERASGFRYFQKAYLIQFHFEDGSTWLVDPMIFNDADASRDALAAFISFLPKRWILHAATQDFPCLFELGLRPTEVFDTELAAKLLGYPRVGLASLLLEIQGLELAKEHSASDWSMRPLTESMLTYAALDVKHLHALKSSLENQLIAEGRNEWAKEEFQHLLGFKPKAPDDLKWSRIPGIHTARDETVSKIAKSLWIARDSIARELDISPGRILPDRSIAAAALAKPAQKSELASNRQFMGRLSRSKIDSWWAAIENAGAVSLDAPANPDRIPHHRSWERRFPEAHARYAEVRPLIVKQAEDLRLQPEVLISPEAIRELCFFDLGDLQEIATHFSKHNVRQWQQTLVFPIVRDWFLGRGTDLS